MIKSLNNLAYFSLYHKVIEIKIKGYSHIYIVIYIFVTIIGLMNR